GSGSDAAPTATAAGDAGALVATAFVVAGEVAFHQHGLLRPLGGAELSDGTLRYLLRVAGLLTPRPPALLVLNEPETSLHPDLLAPLADLIVTAARDTQVVVVTHARPLVAALEAAADDAGTDLQTVELTKEYGQTKVVGQATLDEPPLAVAEALALGRRVVLYPVVRAASEEKTRAIVAVPEVRAPWLCG